MGVPKEWMDEIKHRVHPDEVETQFFDWGTHKNLSENCCDPSTCRVGLTFILPGKSQPEHVHTGVDELHYIISGQGEFYIDEICHAVKAGDLIYIPSGAAHFAISTNWDPLRTAPIKVPALTNGKRKKE